MIKFIKNKSFYANFFLIMLAVVEVLAFLYNTFSWHLNIDEREHLYSSYMIYNGYMPYRDFFQHHHPLLWYVFAPFLIWFKNSHLIWYVLRGFGVVINVGILYFIYKLGKFTGLNKKEAIVGGLLYFLFEAVWSGGKEFRPDNLGILFFIAGIYYFFCYVEKTDFRKLVVSYVLFFLSFMTMQKIVMSLIVMGGIILFLPRDNKNIKKELGWLVVPICGILAYVGYMYFEGALKDYFELNWLLNLKLTVAGILYRRTIFIVPVLISLICVCFIKSSNYYCRALIIMLWAQVAIVLWYAPYFHYFLPLYPFLVILIAYVSKRLFDKKDIIIFSFFIMAGIGRFLYWFNSYYAVYLSSFVRLTKVELSLSDENDEIIPGDIWTGGLRKNALGYYWYGWSVSLLDYKLFKRHEFPDINKIIKEKKPKIIAHIDAVMLGCLNEKNEQDLDNCKTLQKIDKSLLEGDYMVSDFIYLRKY